MVLGDRSLWLFACLVLIGAIATRVGILGWPAQFDEFYHHLAALNWLETGSLSILDGTYDRGAPYTMAVARIMEWTGDTSFAGARMLSVALGVLLPPLLFLWVQRVAGLEIATLATLFALFWPQGIEEAQTVRFYVVQVLAFLGGAISIYMACETRGVPRALWLIGSAVLLVIATLMQVSTIVGIGGIALWWGLTHLLPALRRHRHGRVLIGALVLAIVAFIAFAAASGLLAKLWEFYRWVPGHAERLRDDYWYYHDHLLARYGVLWMATALLLWLAVRENRKLALFCITIFAVAFFVHSFGAFKATRYLSYAMPFYFVVLALGCVNAIRWLADWLNASRGVPRRAGLVLGMAVLLGAVLTGDFPRYSLWMAKGGDSHGRRDWSGMAEVLGDWKDVPYRVTTFELHTIAEVGDYDVLLSPSRMSELPEARQFGIDSRTGRPVISTPEMLTLVVLCVPEGVIFAEPAWWEHHNWQAKMADVLARPEVSHEIRRTDRHFILRWTSDRRMGNDCKLGSS